MAESIADNENKLHPVRALTHLANAVATIDSMLDEKVVRADILTAYRQIIYVRNTLCVALDLWQEDVCRRLSRSKGGFYVYCMTEAERIAFLRRVEPALRFAAEEMANIHIQSLSHLVDMVEKAVTDVTIYAIHNRQSILLGLDGNDFPAFSCLPRTLPSERDYHLLTSKAAAA